MQNVPSTFPSDDSIGFDQEARSPCLNAAARCSGTSQSGSVAMSETMTADPRYAAVPQEPAHGPMGNFSICSVHPLGRLGPLALGDVYGGANITFDFPRLPSDRSAHTLDMLNRSVPKGDSKFDVKTAFLANCFI